MFLIFITSLNEYTSHIKKVHNKDMVFLKKFSDMSEILKNKEPLEKSRGSFNSFWTL